jgi:hypothetical protein
MYFEGAYRRWCDKGKPPFLFHVYTISIEKLSCQYYENIVLLLEETNKKQKEVTSQLYPATFQCSTWALSFNYVLCGLFHR